jgi:protein required for attachment to host cells
MKLANGAWVVVLDGEKRLVFENHGKGATIDLKLRDSEEAPTGRTADLGADKPGRFPVSGGRRETVEQTDLHRAAKEDFAAGCADVLNRAAAEALTPGVVLFADPRSLGVVRHHLSPAAEALLLASVAEDRVRQPVAEIERRIADL